MIAEAPVGKTLLQPLAFLYNAVYRDEPQSEYVIQESTNNAMQTDISSTQNCSFSIQKKN